MGEKSSTQQ